MKPAAQPFFPSAPQAAGPLLEAMSHVSSFLAHSDVGTWKREGAGSGDEGNDGENQGRESAERVFMRSQTVFVFFFFGSAPGGSAASICLLFPFCSEVEQSGKRGASAELLCCQTPFRPSVRPSQASAGVGLQLDDPLASMVTVVQVQKVCVRIQTVLTYKTRNRPPMFPAKKKKRNVRSKTDKPLLWFTNKDLAITVINSDISHFKRSPDFKKSIHSERHHVDLESFRLWS